MGTTQLDPCLKLLSDAQRRKIIHQLQDEVAGETTVEALVDHLDNGHSAEGLDRDQLSIQLIHNHLPKLDDYGIIHYDQEHKIIRYKPDEQIETVLDAIPTDPSQTSPDP